MQRLGAVVPDAHGDPPVVEELSGVVRMDAGDVEAREPHPRQIDARTEHAHAVDRRQPVDEPLPESGLMGGDPRHPDVVQVANGCGERDRLRNALGAGLEALRRRQVFGLSGGDGGDHRAAGEERGHRLEQFAAPVECTDAGRPEHLVTGEHGEVDIERAHVERQMRGRLTGIQQDERADSVGGGDQLLDRVDDAEHVGDVRDGDQLRALGDLILIETERTVVVERDDPQRRAGACGELLPRDEVRVVLHLGRDDLIARAEPEPRRRAATADGRVRERVGDEVDRLGGIGGPDDLVIVGTDEPGHGRPGVFEHLGRLGRERVGAAVHGRVQRGGELSLGIQHGQRALRGRPGIEIDERMPVHLRLQDGEVLAEAEDLRVLQRSTGRGGSHPPSFSPAPACRARAVGRHPPVPTRRDEVGTAEGRAGTPGIRNVEA